jgi:glycosyltransferase involved in cell wall biosynthesis
MNGNFVAYAVQKFPSLRTTFIRREIEALRAQGLPIEVVSMRPADRRELEGEKEAIEHLERTHYLPANPLSCGSIGANLAALFSQPRNYLSNWRRLGLEEPETRTWTSRMRLLLQVWRGAVMAARLRRLGLCTHVHAAFADGAATTALACARLLGVGFSFTSHTSFRSPALRTKLEEAAFIASISEYDRERLIERGGPEIASKIHVIHCGIPLDQWEFAPRDALHDPPRLLSVGALDEKKGHDVLIEACSILRREGRDFCCRIVGDGPLRALLQRKIGEHGLEDVVTLVGPLPQQRVRDELREADVFVLACKRAANGDTDGIPVSLMEAMAAGVPVVSCRIAGVPELMEDCRAGFLSESGDVASLAESLSRCLASRDRRATCEAARKTIERRFSQKTETARLAGLIAEVAIPRVVGTETQE